MARESTEVTFVPGGFASAEHGRRFTDAIPPDAESVAVCRCRAELRVEALVDQRVRRFIEEILQKDRGDRVCEPTAHGFSFQSRSAREVLNLELKSSGLQENSNNRLKCCQKKT